MWKRKVCIANFSHLQYNYYIDIMRVEWEIENDEGNSIIVV